LTRNGKKRKPGTRSFTIPKKTATHHDYINKMTVFGVGKSREALGIKTTANGYISVSRASLPMRISANQEKVKYSIKELDYNNIKEKNRWCAQRKE